MKFIAFFSVSSAFLMLGSLDLMKELKIWGTDPNISVDGENESGMLR